MEAMAETDPVWHVLHVRPRCEKKMAEYTASLGLTADLPLRQETKVYQRRRVTVRKPVFPGYVFAVYRPEERAAVLRSNLIVRILEAVNQAQLVRELAQIRQALAVDPTLDACAAFTRGRWVRVRAGPFQGLEGVVQTVRHRTRVLLNVEMIGRAVAVEISMELLEPVE
jgi:transcription antitermination factor NusG